MNVPDRLKELIPTDRVSTQADLLEVAAHDESSLPGVTPLAVVWAITTEEIGRIVRFCYDTGTPITTRGAGSALEGSTIPLKDGIVLDVSRMTNIENLWPEDLQVRVQPGIVYDRLNDRLKREGLFFPPSPGGSGDIATIGGMVSTNASGIYSVKYGGTREYVLALEIVTGEGEVMKIGNRAIKRSSGYNLIDLISGSEGTLAVISSVTLRLAGIPEDR
ncbi:MAG: FAD-binding oxidoreductase, partial [candidate division Zixibacteria bacterium]|nr:FAD-binding oxidoreductase [candidate division Zixibacteria bacterium]